MEGKVIAIDLRDGNTAKPTSHDSIVIEHGNPVVGHPDVAFETCRSEPERKREALQGVVGSMRAGAAVGKSDRWIELGRETLLHSSS